jgi:hypothetical protein
VPIHHPDDTTAIGADPQRALRIRAQHADAVCAQGRRVAVVVDREPHTIEAHEPRLRPEPQVAVGGLDDVGDVVAREALSGIPGALDVLGDRAMRVERECRPTAEGQHNEYSGNQACERSLPKLHLGVFTKLRHIDDGVQPAPITQYHLSGDVSHLAT